MFSDDDTIIAPLTAPGHGAVTILRLSGSNSLDIVLPHFFTKSLNRFKSLSSHFFYYGFICDKGVSLDEVMVVYMAAPKSYTCEDVVEIHCHASVAVVRAIIDVFVKSGVRIAEPGEFTYRAFKNGRIDLSHAEAIADLIAAKSSMASQLALRQMKGALSDRVYGFKDKILSMLALIEAYIDFPEEDIETQHALSIQGDCEFLLLKIEETLSGYDEGKILRDGFSLLILGKPNVGKSSLLNLLVGEDRAIVTNIPGTTRDIIQETITLHGYPITVIDTAGIRESDDPIEQDGVLRAKKQIQSADVVLYMIDGSQPFDGSIFQDIELLPSDRFIFVINKCDKPDFDFPKEHLSSFLNFSISVKENIDVDRLINGILDKLNLKSQHYDESVILSDRRHKEVLIRCYSYLKDFKAAFESGQSDEFLALHLREALQALGEITGETTPDDILNDIFGRFCIGK
ncbi:tRNA uridine-5-carboxymethylaminomethyl(34) synthesis GTPase MnmE [uncultured Desulfuromonas sp.]|uniref:tRNA uridine-5-carboxymethylaminomethyl(34) synthesis GTPase MnmE n=1 Tax=uncultured Desulfuromonas sp. TaxID=181013 RepID=UPI002AABF101|nr:tRNA uridine-5-carboxymethylaminomethyl(34) synthesis GTPase MnmE [uncultured Desulfuromonas sp.]